MGLNMLPSETLLCKVDASYEKKEGELVLTNKRIVFVEASTQEEYGIFIKNVQNHYLKDIGDDSVEIIIAQDKELDSFCTMKKNGNYWNELLDEVMSSQNNGGEIINNVESDRPDGNASEQNNLSSNGVEYNYTNESNTGMILSVIGIIVAIANTLLFRQGLFEVAALCLGGWGATVCGRQSRGGGVALGLLAIVIAVLPNLIHVY